MERELVAKVDRVIAVSEVLRERLRSMGRDSELLTHGVDPDHWVAAGTPPDCLIGLERPLILFFGVVDRRIDLRLLRRLASDLTSGTIVLVGPEADPDPAIGEIRRVVVRPPMPFRELPSLAAAADVLIMPYGDLPVTRAMQPLKLGKNT